MARLRAVLVVAVVLVLGAWTCQVPTDSPGAGGSAEVPISTTGLTSLVAGEDWHYVDGGGEPAFGATWSNLAGYTPLGFRLRATGEVDIVGDISHASDTDNSTIFTLPAGYRPSTELVVPVMGLNTSTSNSQTVGLIITAGGAVYPWRLVGGSQSVPHEIYVTTSFAVSRP